MSNSVEGEVPPPKDSAPSEVNGRIEQYNRVVRVARLNSIILEKIDFKIQPEALLFGNDQKRDLNVNTVILAFDADSGACTANITWTILIKFKRKVVAKCAASYIVLYDGMTGCDQDTVQMFIDHVGKTATYAYFRALYAHLDWSASLGSPPLPVVQFQPRFGAKRDKEISKGVA